ncbi:YjbE family putative metal transport protein [Fodinisporobacter ferrooxydans]|uniref:YjbE family putative metal transport protein n=1 Tax=Fodinisporobacter ferrooxydans TaxID=2901836 RepID=A0ABY4CPV8_9BACL|nr:YjbE family putative metal transport protein [Alicyclobacillaceae bacterium MYW30-H2]
MQSLVVSFLLILLIDVGLSTDNAAVNAGIVKMFPKQMRNKIMLLGVLVAILMRIVLTAISGYLYLIPGLKLLGGIWVVLMAIKMFGQEDDEEKQVNTNAGYLAAGIMLGWTDLTMSMDNVLALIGAANGNILLVSIGVIITIPLLFLATKALVAIMEKYPKLNFIFAGILGYVGFKMIFEDSGNIIKFFNWVATYPTSFSALSGVLIVVLIGLWVNSRAVKARQS